MVPCDTSISSYSTGESTGFPSCSTGESTEVVHFSESSFVSHEACTVTSETPSEKGESLRECNYDKTVPELYESIQNKKWTDCARLADLYPEQVRTWVFRFEQNGKLRWKMLPLHAAIIFEAPVSVIDALICAYPRAVQSVDDQKMLPIHLALRNGSVKEVVNMLLVAYPQSINVKDRKGRVPLVLAQASKNPNTAAFTRALERGPSYYAVATAAKERALVIEQQTYLFDEKIKKVLREHEATISEERKKARKSYNELAKQYETLKIDSDEYRQKISHLTDTCALQQKKLNAKTNSESYIKQLSSEKDKFSAMFREEKRRTDFLQTRLEEVEKSNENLKGKLKELSNSNDEVSALKLELATSTAEIAILSQQMKLQQNNDNPKDEFEDMNMNHSDLEDKTVTDNDALRPKLVELAQLMGTMLNDHYCIIQAISAQEKKEFCNYVVQKQQRNLLLTLQKLTSIIVESSTKEESSPVNRTDDNPIPANVTTKTFQGSYFPERTDLYPEFDTTITKKNPIDTAMQKMTLETRLHSAFDSQEEEETSRA